MDEVIDELKKKGLKEHTVLYEPKEKKKKNMVKCLKQQFQNDDSATIGFKRTIDKLEEFFLK